MLSVGMTTLLVGLIISTQEKLEVNKQLNKNTVIYLEDKLILDKPIKVDTINIRVIEYKSDTIIVETDSTIKDTSLIK